jgi:hypothetical protein
MGLAVVEASLLWLRDEKAGGGDSLLRNWERCWPFCIFVHE